MATTNLQVRVTADPSSFMQAMGQVNGALSKADAQARKTSSGFAALGSSLTSVGMGLSAAITVPLAGLGVASIKAAADMEVLTMGLKAVMKSASATEKEMDKLKAAAKLPGIDLEGAVRGSIRLQTLGRSADDARDLMKELANAIAIAGGGKDDFAEVTRQLVQMQSVGKVTKENLDTITERIPQISRIMIDTWGPQSVGDPAKFFEKAGISSGQFIDIIKAKLKEGARAGDTFKNSMENAMQDFNLALVEVGETLKPLAQRLLNEFISPAIKGVSDLAKEFRALDPTIQNIALGATGIATAVPVAIIVLGTLSTNIIALKVAIGAVSLAMAAAGTSVAAFGASAVTMIANMAGVAAGTAGATAAIGLFYAGALVAAGSIVYLSNALYDLWKAETKAADAAKMEGGALEILLDRVRKAHPEIGALEVRYRAGQITATDFGAELLRLARTMESTTVQPPKVAAAVKKLGEALKETNKIVVDSIAGLDEKGGLSKTSLLYIEILERTKTAVGLVKDVMYKYYTMGTIVGDQLDTHRSKFDALSVSADGLGTSLHAAGIELDRLSKIPPAQIDITNNGAFRKNSPFEAGDILARGGGSSSQQQFSRVAQLEADLARIKELNAEGKATGNDVIQAQQNLKKAMEDVGKAAKTSGTAQKNALQQVSLVITDLSRGITDVIFKGGKLGDMFKSVAMQAAQSITRLLIEGALAKLATKLLDIGGIMGTVFSGGTGVIKSAVPGITAVGMEAGGLAGIPGLGGAGKTAGGAVGSAAGMGVSAITGMVTGALTAASSIIGNFQMAHMNTALGRMEESLRYMKIWTGEQSQSILWSTQTTAERLLYTNTSLDAIGRYASEMLGNLQQINKGGGMAGGGAVINNYFDGANLFSRNAMQELAEELARILKQQGL